MKKSVVMTTLVRLVVINISDGIDRRFPLLRWTLGMAVYFSMSETSRNGTTAQKT